MCERRMIKEVMMFLTPFIARFETVRAHVKEQIMCEEVCMIMIVLICLIALLPNESQLSIPYHVPNRYLTRRLFVQKRN